MNRRIAACIWLASAAIVYGQFPAMSVLQSMSSQTRDDSQGGLTGTLTAQFRTTAMPSLAGAPFSGEERRSGVQIQSDGTHITSPVPPPVKTFRDSQGRIRMERPMGGALVLPGGRAGPQPIILIEINDTVDGFYYLLDPARKIAYRSKYAPLPPRTVPPDRRPPAPAAVPPAREGMPQTTTESLGIKVIQGVQAEGQRRTTIYPVGFRGNDRPLTDVNETWTSQQLQLTVLSITKSGTGESMSEVVNLSLVAPAADLFRPPADYAVLDKQGTFTVEIGTPR